MFVMSLADACGTLQCSKSSIAGQ